MVRPHPESRTPKPGDETSKVSDVVELKGAQLPMATGTFAARSDVVDRPKSDQIEPLR